MVIDPQDVNKFWIEDVGPKGWYNPSDTLDRDIRDRFEGLWREAKRGGLSVWLTKAHTTLAYLIVTDQFPRNMFRGTGEAFATDNLARAAAKQAIHQGWDMRVREPQRQFFYLPLMHSESLSDQEMCVRLMNERMTQTGAENLVHAKAHRDVIRRFGRFPYRNEALDRNMIADEISFLKAGGYGSALQRVSA